MDQYLELEALGILRQTKLPQELSWLADAQKQLMMDVFFSGEEGLHKRVVAKFQKQTDVNLIELEFKDFLAWENDKNGKPTFLVLTWKGTEVAQLLLQVAKYESKKSASKAP